MTRGWTTVRISIWVTTNNSVTTLDLFICKLIPHTFWLLPYYDRHNCLYRCWVSLNSVRKDPLCPEDKQSTSVHFFRLSTTSGSLDTLVVIPCGTTSRCHLVLVFRFSGFYPPTFPLLRPVSPRGPKTLRWIWTRTRCLLNSSVETLE